MDALVFAELAYAELGGIVPGPEGGSLTLREAAERYEAEGRDQSKSANDPVPLMRRAAGSERFGRALLSAYVDELDEGEQLQFAALTAELDDGSRFVAFRGTDNTIVGWREDFNLGVLSETPGQRRAERYLNETAARHEGPLRVGTVTVTGLSISLPFGSICLSEVTFDIELNFFSTPYFRALFS